MNPHDRDSGWYFDREGRPLSLWEWAEKMQDRAYAIVKQTTVDGYFISTVWLGLNHRMLTEGPPIIFETMAFTRERETLEQERYCTEAEALAGHEAMVTAFRERRMLERWLVAPPPAQEHDRGDEREGD